MEKNQTEPTDQLNQPTHYRGSLYGALRATAQHYPDLYALNFLGLKFRYQLLLKRVDGFASALSEAGINAGDVVSIMLPNCPQAVIALYAVNKLGAIANMVHPLMSEGELEHSLGLVGAKMLVTMDIFYDKASRAVAANAQKGTCAPCQLVVTKMVDDLPIYARAAFKIRAHKEDLPPRPVRKSAGTLLYRNLMQRGYLLLNKGLGVAAPTEGPALAKEPAVILFSGGTTGTSKGILLTNDALNSESFLISRAISLDMQPADRMLCALPLFHGFGLTVCLHSAICKGMECLLVPRLTIKEYTRVIVRGRCNFVVGVPTLLGKIADLPGGNNLDLSFIKEVISGGDALPAEMRRRIDERLAACGSPAHMREGYGATECTAAFAIEPRGASKEGSFGKALDRCGFRIVDTKTGADLPCGQEGELLVSGPMVMAGYWNNPEETRKNIEVDDQGTRWLHTGDIVYADEDGFLFYRGRIKRMIISSGYNIYPNQIEHELCTLPQVAHACVIGIPDGYRLHRIKAFVVPAEGVEATDQMRDEILEALKTRVARYAWPKELEFRSELPLTKVGKVSYRDLEREEEEKRAAAETGKANGDKTREEVAQ